MKTFLTRANLVISIAVMTAGTMEAFRYPPPPGWVAPGKQHRLMSPPRTRTERE
jgi:hypothetical protein